LSRRQQQGVNLIELLIGIVILAVIMLIAVPSYLSYTQKDRLTATVQEFYYNLQFARSEAIKDNSTVYVSIQTGSSWCYGMKVGSACNCTTANSCTLQAVTAPNTQLTLSTTGLISPLSFENTHGANYQTPILTFTLTGQTNALSIEVGMLGNLQLCSAQYSEYPVCV
jgi:type IV fimbrial biogenesis protein FimT